MTKSSTPESAKVGQMARLQQIYRDKIVPELMTSLALENVMQVPRITRITVNMGVGEAVADKKAMEGAVGDLTAITGQKPLVTKSRKSIASFKLRAGVPVGAKVTLRGARMYEFLDRLINVAMPRIRDFRGVSARSFDGRGNYSFGVKEQIIFPEIAYDKIDAIRGMDITITTTARDDREGRALLESFDFPFRTYGPALGEDQHDRAREAPREAREAIRGQARHAQGNHPQPEVDGRGAGGGAAHPAVTAA
jgi:large subunit ribosomal protein L5